MTTNRVVIPRTLAPHAAPRQASLLHLHGAAMGADWSVEAFVPAGFNAPRFEAEVVAALDLVVRQMSPWEPTSDLCRFNRLAPGDALNLPVAFHAVLEAACAVAEETGGAFDPTLGALVDLWGFGPSAAPMRPSPADISAARSGAGWRRLHLDGRRLTQPGGLALDLCGIAKGYAVDLVADAARRAGLASFLIDIGGELSGAGVKPDGQPWWVGIEQPANGVAAPILAALCDLSVATSGDYRRFDMVDGVRISHTIDPETGAPSARSIASATVFHRSCMYADAYATALSVMGAEAGLAHAARHDLAALLVERREDGLREYISPALAAMMD